MPSALVAAEFVPWCLQLALFVFFLLPTQRRLWCPCLILLNIRSFWPVAELGVTVSVIPAIACTGTSSTTVNARLLLLAIGRSISGLKLSGRECSTGRLKSQCVDISGISLPVLAVWESIRSWRSRSRCPVRSQVHCGVIQRSTTIHIVASTWF